MCGVCVCVCVCGCVNVWVCGWMDGWMDRRTWDGWMDGWREEGMTNQQDRQTDVPYRRTDISDIYAS